MHEGPLDNLIKILSTLPGLGPRSARRIALYLLTRKETTMEPLASALQDTAAHIRTCRTCGNLDLTDTCKICRDPKRERQTVCIVAGVADLWAIERTQSYKGLYHVLGGVLSALDGTGPEDLTIDILTDRIRTGTIREVILALSATVEGQSTAHYIADRLIDIAPQIRITRLARGVPVGGELDYLDNGTIATALQSRA